MHNYVGAASYMLQVPPTPAWHGYERGYIAAIKLAIAKRLVYVGNYHLYLGLWFFSQVLAKTISYLPFPPFTISHFPFLLLG